mgnify:CR=1 FL=1
MLELVLIEAQDLIAADLCGTSDPFVSVHYGKQRKRTKVCSHSSLKIYKLILFADAIVKT